MPRKSRHRGMDSSHWTVTLRSALTGEAMPTPDEGVVPQGYYLECRGSHYCDRDYFTTCEWYGPGTAWSADCQFADGTPRLAEPPYTVHVAVLAHRVTYGQTYVGPGTTFRACGWLSGAVRLQGHYRRSGDPGEKWHELFSVGGDSQLVELLLDSPLVAADYVEDEYVTLGITQGLATTAASCMRGNYG